MREESIDRIRGVTTWAAAVVALGLVAAGGLVNAQQAALSVPDWPLSYGRLLLSDWPGNTRYEQLHRVLAVLTALLAGLTIAVGRAAPTGERRKLVGAGVLLGMQILIGGAVVLALAPDGLVAFHSVLGIVIAALFLDLALSATFPNPPSAGPDLDAERLGRRARFAIALLMLQLVLGALSRHPAFGTLGFIVTLLTHLLNAVVFSIVAGRLSFGTIRHGRGSLRGMGIALALLVALQIAIGLTLFMVAPEPLDQPYPPDPTFVVAHVLHLSVAAALLATLAAIRRLMATRVAMRLEAP